MSELENLIEDIEKYQGDSLVPNKNMSILDYQEMALQLIRQQYPEATMECFSGRYSLSYWNEDEDVSFTDRASSREYPGCWFAGPMKITNDEFVEKLVEDGLRAIEKNQPKFDEYHFDY